MTSSDRHIIALGGGGFSMEPENPALDRYILEQAQTSNPSIGFIGTASGDSDRYLVGFYSTFSRFDCRPSHLPFFTRTPDLRVYLHSQDIIYVGGGNTKSMLAVWRDWGLPELLREAWASGVVIAGVSAGAICWFEQGLTDSYDGSLEVLNCLGFLSGSCCPHYDGEADRRPTYIDALQQEKILPGYALDDGAAVHFRGIELYRAVASRPDACVYRLTKTDETVNETPIDVDYLLADGQD